MKIQDEDVNVQMQSGNRWSKFTWLLAGVGIGAAVGILLAPQSGENTRERISTKTRNRMEAVNSKIRQTGQQVGDWIDESKQQVREAVDAGRDAFSKARSGAT
jgi:gas vesicle protein